MKITLKISARFDGSRRTLRRQQAGAVLIVGLIFLMVLSLLGVSVMQSGMLEERMAGNMRDWNVAFQAAESALRDAEADVRGGRITGAAGFVAGCGGSGVALGLCLPGASTPVWDPSVVDFTDSASTVKYVTYGAKTSVAALTGVATQPRYIIEALPNQRNISISNDNSGQAKAGKYLYRITARGYGASITSKVTLQSVYNSPS